MGEIVRLAEVRARRLQVRDAGHQVTSRTARPLDAFEGVDCGSGWYHGEAIRAARTPLVEPR